MLQCSHDSERRGGNERPQFRDPLDSGTINDDADIVLFSTVRNTRTRRAGFGSEPFHDVAGGL